MIDDFEIVCVDECVFSWRGYKKHEWAPKYENLELHRHAGGPSQTCIACVGAISMAGKEHFYYAPKSINGDQFLEFLV